VVLMTSSTPPEAPPPPRPRRIHLDATGWSLLRQAAAELGLPVDRLPDTPGDPASVPPVRELLVAQDLLDPDGAPTPSVHAALVVLGSAPVTITVERVNERSITRAVWGTAGAPTAGVVVRQRLGQADEPRDVEHRAVEHLAVELQLLAIDDLLDLVLAELIPGGTPGAVPDAREPVEVDADDPAALPAGLIEDGRLVARAAVTIEGLTGSSVAQLLGDGQQWWQVCGAAPGRLRLDPIQPSPLRAALLGAVTQQLTSTGSTVTPEHEDG
jgi:hypothetical protein